MASPTINSTHVLWTALDAVAQGGNPTNSILTQHGMVLGQGYGWLPSQDAIRHNSFGGGATGLAGFLLATGEEKTGVNAVDGSSTAASGKRLFYTHLYASTGYALASVDSVSDTGYGHIFWLLSTSHTAGDRDANCRGWCVGGSDSIPILMGPTPTNFICVDPDFTDTEVEVGTGADKLTHIDVTTAGNEFDSENIETAGFSFTGGAQFALTASRFGYYDAYTCYGGEAKNPGTFAYFYQQTQAEYHYAFALGDGAQYRCRMAMEFGHANLTNTDSTYFYDENGSLVFATAPTSLTDPSIRSFHGPPNKLGMEAAFRSGDIFTLKNYSLSSGTPWHFRFDSNVGAIIQFLNCIVQNAGGTDDDCEINSDVVFDGGLIDGCGVLAVNGGSIKNCSVSNPINGSLIEIVTASDLENISFETSDGTDRAIEIPDPSGGTVSYDLDNLSYSGFYYDILVNGSTGTVNLNILNGGDTPLIAKGTETVNTVALLGSGWVDGSSYTAVSSSTGERGVVVAVSNDGSKLPTGCTFGGEAMILLESNLASTIGLSLFLILEDDAESVFTGAQTIAASYSGGSPTNITYQAATYDYLEQRQSLRNINTISDNNTSTTGTVASLDDWQSASEITSDPSFSISSGSNRVLIVIVNHEDNGGSPGATSVTWGGRPLTKQVGAVAGTFNTSELWYLLEEEIALGDGTTIEINGTSGDNPSYGAASFSGVNQEAPFRDSDVVTGSNPSTGATMNIRNGDMIVASFASTGGASSTSWNNDISTPDSTFADNTADDPSEGAYKAYSGSDTTTGTVGASGGDTTRTIMCVGILVGPVSAGDLEESVLAKNKGAVISACQMSTVQDFTWTGDAVKQDEVDRTGESVSTAHYLPTADGLVDMGFSNTETTTGETAQLIMAALDPSSSYSGGPTVNVINSVTLTVNVIDKNGDPISGAQVWIFEKGAITEGDHLLQEDTNALGIATESYSYGGSPVDIVVRVRKSEDTDDPRYKPKSGVGTINENGFSTIITLIENEVLS